MGIIIGDNNVINNSTINEEKMQPTKKNWAERHPVIISALISFVVGFLLLFSFWEDLIMYLEGVL